MTIENLYQEAIKEMIIQSLQTSKEITECPHCESTKFVKNGKRKGLQVYLCRSCSKQFTEQTGTPMLGTTKDLKVWKKFVDCMLNNLTLRQSADLCNITLATAQAWKHKILESIYDDTEVTQVYEAYNTQENISLRIHNKNKEKYLHDHKL